ncbi:MAG: outer membrane beta-barrel protein [Crocinitomix sp.]|nr:outer membrane beta-barrel protein [Crocinitomix sp.]
MKFIIFLISLVLTTSTIAQATIDISGSIVAQDQKGIDLAMVSLFKANDSTLLKTEFTDEDGTYLISNIAAGAYIIRIKQAGYLNYSQEIDINSSETLEPIILTLDQNELDEVTVDGSVPFVVRKIDRTVITPDALIASVASNALEILEQAPGVSVDQNGQISLKGRTGLAVYINDKPSYLSGADLENYLRSLPASSIKDIEIIENPPAKYEAAGNSGIININIKRSTFKGFYGNASVSYRRSRYNGSNNSVNLNYNRKKVSLTSNINAGFWENFQDLNINRYYLNEAGVEQSAFEQNSFNNRNGQYLQGQIGLDIYATDRTKFGVSFKKSISPGERKVDNTSLISDANGVLLQSVVADNISETSFNNNLLSLYFTQELDTLGSEITFDADYVQYLSTNDQLFKNFQYNAEDVLTYEDQINGEIPSKISIYAVKTDYTKPFIDGSNFEAGLKSAFTQTDNEAIYTTTVDGITEPNYGLSNRFLYDEWINAAYLNYNRKIGKTTVQMGLRGEITQLKGNQLGNVVTSDTSFTRNYGSLFPTFYALRQLDTAGVHSLNLSYGRRIERPYFQDLNPFISPLDKFTFYTGNPNLLPTFSHNFSLTHSYKNLLHTSLSYALIVDGINETLEIQDEIYYSRPGNIATSQYLTLAVNGTLPVTSWYTINFYTEASAVKFESQLYTEQLNSSGINVYASMTNSFNLKNGWKLNLSGRYSSNQVYSQLFIKGYAFMNFGVQKSVLDGKGTFRLSLNDILYSRIGDGVINNLSQTNADWNSKYDSRNISVAFSIRFGKSNSNKKKHEGSGSESEQNRVKG